MSINSADHESAPETNSGPEQPGSAHELTPSSAQRRQKILTRDEAMMQLSSLPMLIVCGLLTVAQANSIRMSLNSVIQAHDRLSVHRDSPVENLAPIAEQLRQFPEMANHLAAILPHDLVDRLMEGYRHD